MTTISEKKLLKLGEDFKTLQKQNKILKQDNKKLIDNGGYVSEGCANHMASKLKDDLIIQLREKNEELKEENQKLVLKSLYREIRVDKLILEKKEQKKKNKMQFYHEGYLEHEMKLMWDENVKLIEEIKLKDEIITLHETS